VRAGVVGLEGGAALGVAQGGGGIAALDQRHREVPMGQAAPGIDRQRRARRRLGRRFGAHRLDPGAQRQRLRRLQRLAQRGLGGDRVASRERGARAIEIWRRHRPQRSRRGAAVHAITAPSAARCDGCAGR
jgi:hypothetical protein